MWFPHVSTTNIHHKRVRLQPLKSRSGQEKRNDILDKGNANARRDTVKYKLRTPQAWIIGWMNSPNPSTPPFHATIHSPCTFNSPFPSGSETWAAPEGEGGAMGH
eukprot:jgi/Botrbrau1/9668/Bobra.0201s0003.1